MGEKLGHATVLLDGKRVGRVPLVAAEDVAAPSIIDKAGGARAVAAIVFGLIVILLVAAWALRRRGERRHKGRSAEERMRSLEERDRRRNSIGGEG